MLRSSLTLWSILNRVQPLRKSVPRAAVRDRRQAVGGWIPGRRAPKRHLRRTLDTRRLGEDTIEPSVAWPSITPAGRSPRSSRANTA